MSRADSGREASAPGILIFGYGNPSRGDDALGPVLVERLEILLDADCRRRAGGIEWLTDFQLQVEHALDLAGRRLVLFVDAHLDCPAPFQFSRLESAADVSYSTHAISPASVLHVYRDYHGSPPPPSFLLGIRGASFELGEGLSPAAENHLAAALELVQDLCLHPEPQYWQSRCHSRPPPSPTYSRHAVDPRGHPPDLA